MFEIVIHKKFAKKLEKMERTQLERIAILMEVLKGEPIPWKKFDIKKIEGMKNTYRVRIGKYRLVYFIDENARTIHILKIETRQRAYR